MSAISGGRLAVASPLPAYQPFADYALLVDSLAQGVSTALILPAKGIEERIAAGQAALMQQFSPDILGRKWTQTLANLTRRIRRAKASV